METERKQGHGRMLGTPRSNRRLAISLLVLVALALLAWQTMEPGRAQELTWLLLGFFAFRIVLSSLGSRKITNERTHDVERRQ